MQPAARISQDQRAARPRPIVVGRDMHTKDDRSGPSTKPRRFPADENSDTAIIVGLALWPIPSQSILSRAY